MRLFLDTNVILDIFMRREPFYAASAQVVYLCESGKHIGGITTLTACNVVYALRKRVGLVKTIGAIKQLLTIVKPISTSVPSLLQSLETPLPDFEDAIQLNCAREWNADVIVTRDKTGFVDSTITVQSPSDFLLT